MAAELLGKLIGLALAEGALPAGRLADLYGKCESAEYRRDFVAIALKYAKVRPRPCSRGPARGAPVSGVDSSVAGRARPPVLSASFGLDRRGLGARKQSGCWPGAPLLSRPPRQSTAAPRCAAPGPGRRAAAWSDAAAGRLWCRLWCWLWSQCRPEGRLRGSAAR